MVVIVYGCLVVLVVLAVVYCWLVGGLAFFIVDFVVLVGLGFWLVFWCVCGLVVCLVASV